MISTAEFDAFGPWVDEVPTVAALPRLYRDSGVDPAACRLVLKVPRNVERRNAHPGMHLYDHLIALDDETLVVLHRREDTYDTVRVPVDRIVAIADSTRLLDGRLTVHLADGGTVVVPYNGSSNAPIRRLIALLRASYLPVAAPESGEPARPEPAGLGREDTGLLNDYDELMRQEPGMRLLNVGPRQTVRAASRWERLYRRARPLTLQAGIAVSDEREIVLVHRRDWFTRHADDISMARTVLPRARIDEVTARPHERYLGVHVVTVTAGTTRIEFPVTAGPVTDALVTLKA
ncbi:hypothetical protein [Actinoplanes sp. RD1]|uniref:hypothetical protein n=1 Tax=Actinoplanes sp. RD1 TaxID=3064538 RepID=UPI002741EB0B|nr:hypothetical protein [Actinoplanes sp. RD1]